MAIAAGMGDDVVLTDAIRNNNVGQASKLLQDCYLKVGHNSTHTKTLSCIKYNFADDKVLLQISNERVCVIVNS